MSQRHNSQQNTANDEYDIDRVNSRKWGYNIAQVDEFLTHIPDLSTHTQPSLTEHDVQVIAFDLEKGGYSIRDVDRLLLETQPRIVDAHTQWVFDHNETPQWVQETYQLASTVQPRAELDKTHRFTRGSKKEPAYDIRQVDQVVDDAWKVISETLHIRTSASLKNAENITAKKVSNALFTQRKAANGYKEEPVDAYLNRIIQILERFESIQRLGLTVHFTSQQLEQQSQYTQQASQRTELKPLKKPLSVQPVAENEKTQIFKPVKESHIQSPEVAPDVTSVFPKDMFASTSLQPINNNDNDNDVIPTPSALVIPPSFATGHPLPEPTISDKTTDITEEKTSSQEFATQYFANKIDHFTDAAPTQAKEESQQPTSVGMHTYQTNLSTDNSYMTETLSDLMSQPSIPPTTHHAPRHSKQAEEENLLTTQHDHEQIDPDQYLAEIMKPNVTTTFNFDIPDLQFPQSNTRERE